MELPTDERDALLGLTSIAGVGSALAIRLIDKLGCASAAFTATLKELRQIEGIGEELAERLQQGPDRKYVAEICRLMERSEIKSWVYGMDNYPQGFKRLSSPPLIVYVRGQFTGTWQETQAVAVVGTRHPDRRGLALTKEVSQHLASDNWRIVSGGALGIDTAAHRAALEVGGVTISVMATGVDCPYPAQNKYLFMEICERGGALVSEFPPGTRPERGYFPRRNRLIGALCQGVVVMQCGAQSGALQMAASARAIGVPILTFPGYPREELSAGPHHLIRRGAILVESASEISAILRGEEPTLHSTQLELWSNTEITGNKAPDQISPEHQLHKTTALNESKVKDQHERSPNNLPQDSTIESNSEKLDRLHKAPGYSDQKKAHKKTKDHQAQEPRSQSIPPDKMSTKHNWPQEFLYIFEILSCGQQMHLDEIAWRARRPVSEITADLVSLELLDLIESRPGMIYSLK
jgi:DNA processing protein